MPRFLCLWALTRQAHKELQNFCVPELEAALDILQVTPSQVQAWPGPDWDIFEVESEGLGKSDSGQTFHLKNACQLCKVHGCMSPCQYTDVTVALQSEVKVGPNGTRSLLCAAYFEDETTVLRALQHCGLLTAIIEVRWSASLIQYFTTLPATIF